MCSFIVDGRLCKIPSKDNEYCHVHTKSAKMVKKINDQANEITILNRKLSEASRKLQLIEECDYIKYQLTPLAKFCSFRQAITDPYNKDFIEELFNCDQHMAIHVYNEMITKRNMIAHKYTSRDWIQKKGRTKHGRSVKDLLKTLKTYQL
jgi:hypothetical protein